MLTSVLPWPLHRNGGAQRTQLIRQALLESGYGVDVFGILPDIPGNPATLEPAEALAGGIVQIVRYPLISAGSPGGPRNPLQRVIDTLTSVARIKRAWCLRYSTRPHIARAVQEQLAGGQYSHLLVRYLHTGIVAGLDDPRIRGDVPWVADLDDVDWLTLQSRFEREPWPGRRGRRGMRAVASIVRRHCERALAHVAACFVASEEDRQAVTQLGAQCEVLPNLPFPPEERKPSPLNLESFKVLFVGDLQFPPNRHGLGRFLEEVWPRVRAAEPRVTLQIVGRGGGDGDAETWGRIPGVHLAGFVEDLQRAYDEAAVVVAPIWWGGGTKIKVLEALSHGRGCVTTEHGARGYDSLVRANCGLVVTETGEAMASRLSEFLADPALRRLAWERGPAVVHEDFSIEAFRERIATTLSAVRCGRVRGRA